MRHLFIINPASGPKSSAPLLTEKIRTLSLEHDILCTEQKGDACRFARQAAQRGDPVRIYACGGDGTLSEVVNGAAGYPHVAITNVPTGTGNDFLRIFGREGRTHFLDLPALADGPQATFDLIDCNGHLGINIACVGIDARVASDVHHYKRLPFVGKKLAYILSLLVNVLFKEIARPMEVFMGDFHCAQEVSLLCVCNGRFYGGGFMPMGEAMPDDGVLDMLLVPKVGLAAFARLVGKYAHGRYKELLHILTDYHGQSVTLSSQQEMTAVVDGETICSHSFHIRLSDKKVNFFYPPNVSYRPHQLPLSAARGEAALP